MSASFIPASVGISNSTGLSAGLYGAVSTAPKPIIRRPPRVRFYRNDPPDSGYDYDSTNDTPNNEFTVDNDVGNDQTVISTNKNDNSNCKAVRSLMLLLVVIIITIIIFVAVLSVYNVIKEGIVNRYARKALMNPRSNNSSEDIERTLIANDQAYEATIYFSIVCIFIAMIFLPFLFYAYILLSR